MAEYVFKVNAPFRFQVKCNKKWYYGPFHFWHLLRSIYLFQIDASTKDKLYATLKRNAFYPHPENLLVSMLNDSSEIIRRKSVETITEKGQRGMSETR